MPTPTVSPDMMPVVMLMSIPAYPMSPKSVTSVTTMGVAAASPSRRLRWVRPVSTTTITSATASDHACWPMIWSFISLMTKAEPVGWSSTPCRSPTSRARSRKLASVVSSRSLRKNTARAVPSSAKKLSTTSGFCRRSRVSIVRATTARSG